MNIEKFFLALNPAKIKMGLQRTHKLLELCGNPEKKLTIIQVAGTNGKGSVCAMLESIFRHSGHKTGLFTSPHLYKINERIRINGIAVSNEKLNDFISLYNKNILDVDASFFEALTATALWLFNNQNVDIAVMETGLGGRLDSVTACDPKATVITKISLDHIEILGNSLEKITYEKAGILKPKIPCFSSPQSSIVKKILKTQAKKIGCPLFFSNKQNKIQINLIGSHQEENARLARNVIQYSKLFNIDNNQINYGLKNINWFARYQVLKKNPKIIFDVGHNHDGISAFINTFSNEKIIGKKYLVIALKKRKQIKELDIKITTLFDHIYCGEVHIKNYMSGLELFEQLGSSPKAKIIGDINHTKLGVIVSSLNKKDCLAIVGTHYFGKSVSQAFKISFDNL